MSIDVKDVEEKRKQLHRIIIAVNDVLLRFKEITGQDDPETENILSGLAKRAETESFKILIVGEFKNGKSTFINAMLGEKILPDDVLPCTAVISEVVYGEEKGALIHFENPLPEVISEHISEKIKEHISSHKEDAEGVPPLEMTFDELKVLTIPEDELLGSETEQDFQETEDDQDEIRAGKKAIARMPFRNAEIRFPLEILKGGIEIIDTPGLNEDKSREEVTRNYLKNADAIIFLFKYPKILNMNEKESVDNLRLVHKDIFFVINAVDLARSSDELKRVYRLALNKLAPLTGLKDKGIFFVSALKALESGHEHGMEYFESSLSKYLSINRGTAKLASICRSLQPHINNIKSNAELILRTFEKALEDAERHKNAGIKAREREIARRKAEVAKLSEARKKYDEEMAAYREECKKYNERLRILSAEKESKKSELANNAEERKRHEEAIRKLREEHRKLSETQDRLAYSRKQLLSELTSLNDEYEMKKRQREQFENELRALKEENFSKKEDHRKRLDEARNILSEAESLKQKIADRLSKVKQTLQKIIRDNMEDEYDFILNRMPSFAENMSVSNSIGVIDAMLAGDEPKRKLAVEVGEKLNDFFSRELKEWFISELKILLEAFITDLLKEIEPDLESFYGKLDDYIKNIAPESTGKNSKQNALSRLANTTAGLSFRNLGYTAAYFNGDVSTQDDTLLGGLITEIFGTSIFSTILKIGDNIITTALSLLTFWNLGDNATKAVKKGATEKFIEQMKDQKHKACEGCAVRLSQEMYDKVMDVPNISKGLSEEISNARKMEKNFCEAESSREKLAEAEMRDKSQQIEQAMQEEEKAKHAKESKESESRQKEEKIREVAMQSESVHKKEYEAQNQAMQVQSAMEKSREQMTAVQIKESAEQARAEEKENIARRAEEKAEAAKKSEMTEQSKLDEAERKALKQNEEANAKFNELQKETQVKIDSLKEILQILNEKQNALAEYM